MPSDKDEWMTPEMVEEEFHIPQATLRYYRSRSEGPAYHKPAGRVLYNRADVLAWINSARIAPASVREIRR